MESRSSVSLDEILAKAEQKAEEARQEEQAQHEIITKEINRQKAIAQHNDEATEKRIITIVTDINKYLQIIDNQHAQDLKAVAWDSLVAAYPETKDIASYDLVSFYSTMNIPLTYTDHNTGLIWSRNGSIDDKKLSYEEANEWVKNIDYADYKDWRLPDINELLLFMKRAGKFPSVWFNSNGFIKVQANKYWTTSNLYDYLFAECVNLKENIPNHNRGSTFSFSELCVWPVRSGINDKR